MSRPRAAEPYQTFNIIIPIRQLLALRRLAHERRCSVAALMRAAIDHFLGDEPC